MPSSERPPAPTRRRRRRAAALAAALALLAGCSGGGTDDPGGTASPPDRAAAGDARDLAGVCPAKVVVQAAWFPTADLATPFQLFAADWSIDAARKRVSGSLVSAGRDTGVDLEFRSGGPATGFQTGPAVLHSDSAVTLAYTNVDEIIALSATLPVQGVFAPLNGDPQALLWDPDALPTVDSIVDIGQTDVPVVHSANAGAVFGYLTGSGILRAGQLDGSYDGSPSRFVASRGKVVVQGYATNEPYLYEKLPAWGRPVAYQLVQETGYPNYADVLAIRTADRERLAPCLRRLVPVLQRAQIEFMVAPAAALDRVVRSVAAFRAGFVYDRGNAEFGACQLRDLGLVSNTRTGTLGAVEEDKVDRMLDILRPLLAAQRRPARQGLTDTDVATNEFVDPALGLPAKSFSTPTCATRRFW